MPAKRSAPAKRAYDSARRRERAEEERQATRRRVVDAAHQLFVERGYVATTMADIAETAGVALQSVYKAGTSKAELLNMVVDLAVAGDDEPVLIAARPPFAAIAAEPDPKKQVAIIAELITATQQRSAAVQRALRQAAAVDGGAATTLVAQLERRRETIGRVVAMIHAQHLRHSVEDSTDLVWAVGSTEVYLLLRDVRGWDAHRFQAWLSSTLRDALLTPDA
jgi:AcrR family transcriptional regulator